MRYERTGEFRAPRKGEWYEAKDGAGSPAQAHGGHDARDRRWILREVKEVEEAPEKWDTADMVSWISEIQLQEEMRDQAWGDRNADNIREIARRVRVVGRLEEYLCPGRYFISGEKWLEGVLEILNGEGV